MTDFLQRLFRLWSDPLPEGEGAVAAFRQVYADPVPVNGVDFSAAALVERARTQQRAFEGLEMELIDELHAPGKIVVVFRQRGRHTGPLPTPLGEVAPTGRDVDRQIIDVLTIKGGLVVDVRVVSDDLGLLVRLGAVTLV
jgi:hypothetical protein